MTITDFARAITERLDADPEIYANWLVDKNLTRPAVIKGEKKSIKRYITGEPSIFEVRCSLQKKIRF